MALYITNPHSSFVATGNILDSSNAISGLNINKEKSLIYPIFITKEEESILRDTFPYARVETSWRYLGVNIPLQFHRVNVENLDDLNSSGRSTLKSWSDSLHTCYKCIQIVKTMIFPKFLFLFRALPLIISPKLLRGWQSTLM